MPIWLRPSATEGDWASLRRQHAPDLLDAEIKRLKQMTDKPFAVNIMLMSPTAEDAIEVVAENRVPS